jgi:hypothetical protein
MVFLFWAQWSNWTRAGSNQRLALGVVGRALATPAC